MIKEHPHDWIREILVIGTPSYIRQFESDYLHSLDAARDINSFNMHNGDGKFTTAGMPMPKDEKWKIKNRKQKSSAENYIGNRNGSGNLNKQKTQEHRDKIGLSKIGKPRPEFSDEWKRALKKAWVDKPILTCPHCMLQGKGPNMKRYHFEKCRKA